MKSAFVQTENVKRFLAAVQALEGRGAAEASLMLVVGDAGYGKSRTGEWWALRNDAVHVRVMAAATPHWVLSDIVRELGESAPAHFNEQLFAQAVGVLARDRRPIVIDEVENALRHMAVIETIRDLSDVCEIPVVLIGREHIRGRLRREKQIWSRVSAIASFAPATEADVGLACDTLAEVAIDPQVVAEIHRQSEGRIREVVKAIANVERIGRRSKGPVTLAAIGGMTLTQEFQKTAAANEPKPKAA